MRDAEGDHDGARQPQRHRHRRDSDLPARDSRKSPGRPPDEKSKGVGEDCVARRASRGRGLVEEEERAGPQGREDERLIREILRSVRGIGEVQDRREDLDIQGGRDRFGTVCKLREPFQHISSRDGIELRNSDAGDGGTSFPDLRSGNGVPRMIEDN